MEKHLTAKEVASILGVSVRAVQARCKRAGIQRIAGEYMIPESMVNEWGANVREHIRSEGSEEVIVQEFTQAEFDLMQQLIHERPQITARLDQYEKEVQYLRQALDKANRNLEQLTQSLQNQQSLLGQANNLQALQLVHGKIGNV